ncbi:hypothetical protein EV702DRAFT_1205124 [Suillus placidus]|uniref:Uncharacterized protein n=1 Tax=Suillus placidus TaxID=48579 RepID=A0A9P7CVJ9_9AGAM|nr:hypothetical protein EV702DRAFT_1205124 [Suillus placidus]
MSKTTVVYSTYLLPDPTVIDSTPEENTTEPRNRHGLASDESKYSVVEGTKFTVLLPPIKSPGTSQSLPRAKHNIQIVNPTPSQSNPLSASLLEHFTCWAAKTDLSLSSSARRVYNKVFQFLEKESQSEFTEIFGVGPEEYAILEQFCEDFGLKPRLTHIRSEQTLFIEMPTMLHEAPMAMIQSAFHDFFHDVPYPKKRFITVNLLTNVTKDGAIPDLRISIQNICDRQLTLIIPTIGESAFSQHLAPLFLKLRQAVAANPALLMIIVAVVQELRPYSRPKKGSIAYNVLLDEPKCSWDDFQLAVGGMPALDRPIVVEGHTWCSLRSVRFKVWLRGTERIDIDSVDPNLFAQGSLFPADNDMATVHSMINRGAEAIRESLVELCRSMVPEMDLAPLRNPDIRLQLEDEDFIDRLLGAMSETAYERYSYWYKNTPRPRKLKHTRATDRAAIQVDRPNTRSQKRRH